MLDGLALQRPVWPAAAASFRDPTTEGRLARWSLIAIAVAFLALVLFLPLAAVLAEALRRGWQVPLMAVREPDALSAIRLTLLVAALAVPANLVFGVAAAWAIAKFEFRGRLS